MDNIQVTVLDLNLEDMTATLQDYHKRTWTVELHRQEYDYSDLVVGKEFKADITRSCFTLEYRLDAFRDVIY